jgi:hypothetical protein
VHDFNAFDQSKRTCFAPQVTTQDQDQKAARDLETAWRREMDSNYQCRLTPRGCGARAFGTVVPFDYQVSLVPNLKLFVLPLYYREPNW